MTSLHFSLIQLGRAAVAALAMFAGASGAARVATPPTAIVNLGSGKCLDVAGGATADGAAVNQFGCHGGDNQQWWLEPEGSAPGAFSMRNRHSDRCLDDPAGGATPGRAQQYGCHHGANQVFRMEPVGDTARGMRMVSTRSGLCLGTAGPGDGLPVAEQACGNGLGQRWMQPAPAIDRQSTTLATVIPAFSFTYASDETNTFRLAAIAPASVVCMHLQPEGGSGRTACAAAGATSVSLVDAGSVRSPVRVGRRTLRVFTLQGPPVTGATLTVTDDAGASRRINVARFGGTAVTVPGAASASAYQYQTAPVPGGATRSVLLALDASQRVAAVAEGGGAGGNARISGAPAITRVVVGVPLGAGEGRVRLYANDVAQDGDGDGLGRELERTLGSCDGATDHPRCAFVVNLRDSDRDGLDDAAEVFGVPGNAALLLPAWGASPVHKDLFVEADWTSEFSATPLNRDRIRRMQFHLAHGPASHLDNLDGGDGIALHVDAGIVPADATDRTLFGAWGGAARVDAWTPAGPPAGSFDPVRLPYFHQLLLVRGGGSNGFGRYWYATGEDPDTIMHEFGHTLGLQHESVVPGPGGPVIAGLNCSPAYPSIMSYATPHASFLTGDGFPPEGINPSNLCEADGMGAAAGDLSYITRSLGGLIAGAGGVDWNRDTAFAGSAPAGGASRCRPGERVRAVINWGYSGCDAHTQGALALSPQVPAAGRRDGGLLLGGPALARVGDRLHVVYIKRDDTGMQRLFHQSAAIGARQMAGCTAGFRVHANGVGDPCLRFAGPFEIGLLEPAPSAARIVPARVAAVGEGDALHLAVADARGLLRTARIAAADLAAGQATLSVPTLALQAGPAGSPASAGSDLTLAVLALDARRHGGDGRQIALFYVQPDGSLHWASRAVAATGNFIERGPVHDGDGVALSTAAGDSPALAAWPGAGAPGDAEAYMVLQRADAAFRLFRHDRAAERWLDITPATFGQDAVTGPGHNQKIAFWFQHLLDARGEVIEQGKGFFSLLFRYGENRPADAPGPSTPSLRTLQVVSRAAPPSQGLRAAVFQKFGHDWYGVRGNNLPQGTGGGFAVLADETMTGAKAVLLKTADTEGNVHDLTFLPFADGIFDMAFRPSPDFKVMEGTLCRSMRGDTFCGRPSQSRWGF